VLVVVCAGFCGGGEGKRRGDFFRVWLPGVFGPAFFLFWAKRIIMGRRLCANCSPVVCVLIARVL